MHHQTLVDVELLQLVHYAVLDIHYSPFTKLFREQCSLIAFATSFNAGSQLKNP